MTAPMMTALLATTPFNLRVIFGPQRVEELVALVTGRGACAHPDGTARLAASVLRTFPGELAAHRRGRCDAREPGWEMSA